MECGKLTAKLRDAVPVIFIEEGREAKRFKNVEIPDELKEIEYQDFKFDVPANGQITFKIFFEAGALPEVWPENRERKHRSKKVEAAPLEEHEPEAMTEPMEEPATMEFAYNVIGERRKALAAAIGEYVDAKPQYLGMPTKAYRIGDYMVSKDGTLTGPMDQQMVAMLTECGFEAE
jgi:hypothetical protein